MLTRVLLADDHQALLTKVAGFLSSTCEIVGAVRDGQALLEATARLHPDVLVVDISMPVLSGIDAARQLKQSGTTAKIIFLTVHEDPDFVQAALAAGGSGYVVKSRLATDLLRAMQAVLEDRRFISPSIFMGTAAPEP